MKTIVLTLLTGAVFGTIDILPMIKMKLEKPAILSAFTFYLIVPFIIYNIHLFGMPWWLKGGLVTFFLALPIIILTAGEGLSSTIPITVMSVVLGTLIGIIGKFVLKVM